MKRYFFLLFLIFVVLSSNAESMAEKAKAAAQEAKEKATTAAQVAKEKATEAKDSVTKLVKGEYPAELRGVWVSSPELCAQAAVMGITIDKETATYGMERTCKTMSVQAIGGKFLIKEKCRFEGGSSTSENTYTLIDNSLVMKIGPDTIKHQRCK